MDRFEEACFHSLARALGKSTVFKVDVDYAGDSGEFAGLIDKINGTLAALYNNSTGYKNIYSQFMYVLLPTVLAYLSANDGLHDTYCQAEKELIANLLASTDRYPPYNYMPQYICSRIFSQINYSKLDVGVPSLELGISDGTTSRMVWGNRKLTVGSEPFVDAMKIAKNYNNYNLYMSIDSKNIPFEDNLFASVIAMNMLYHTKPKLSSIKEMARVVAPGGILAFDDITPEFEGMRPLPSILGMMGLNKSKQDLINFRLKHEDNLLSGEDYRDLLSGLGFEEILVTPFLSERLCKLNYLLFDLDSIFRVQALEASVKQYFFKTFNDILAALIAQDREYCEKEKLSGYNLIVARKRGDKSVLPLDPNRLLDHMICPKCQGALKLNSDICVCDRCRSHFFIADGMFLLMPFQGEHYSRIMNS